MSILFSVELNPRKIYKKKIIGIQAVKKISEYAILAVWQTGKHVKRWP